MSPHESSPEVLRAQAASGGLSRISSSLRLLPRRPCPLPAGPEISASRRRRKIAVQLTILP
jgi:hypothetical protein